MARFICSDWHLGEERMQIMQRPFKSQREMIEHLIAEHNAIVGPDDLVLMLGDVCNQKTPEFLSEVARFNGKKILVRGNHDRVITDEQFAPYFSEIIPEGQGLDLEVTLADKSQLSCFATHYPSRAVPDKFNLVGHIHSAWKFQLNMVNIGVDVNHFKPFDLDEFIPFAYGAIGFYDQDVWIAYDPVNQDFVGKRGKAGVYFPKT